MGLRQLLRIAIGISGASRRWVLLRCAWFFRCVPISLYPPAPLFAFTLVCIAVASLSPGGTGGMDWRRAALFSTANGLLLWWASGGALAGAQVVLWLWLR